LVSLCCGASTLAEAGHDLSQPRRRRARPCGARTHYVDAPYRVGTSSTPIRPCYPWAGHAVWAAITLLSAKVLSGNAPQFGFEIDRMTPDSRSYRRWWTHHPARSRIALEPHGHRIGSRGYKSGTSVEIHAADRDNCIAAFARCPLMFSMGLEGDLSCHLWGHISAVNEVGAKGPPERELSGIA